MRWAAYFLFSSAVCASAEPQCLAPPFDAADQPALTSLIQRLDGALEQFPSLREAFDTAAPTLCLSDALDGAEGYLDVERNRIVIDTGHPPDLQFAILLHELRHLEQLTRGFCPSTDYSMKENARAVWAIEADASAVSLLVAWALKEQDAPGTWEALKGWAPQTDVALAFEAAMLETGDAGAAAAAAFDQWYASEARREDYYVASCSDYLERQEKENALPRYQLLPTTFFEDLCKLPDGSAFSCAQPALPDR